MKKIAITCALLSSLVASSVWADAASDLKSRLDKVSSFHASFTQKVTDGSGAAVQEGQGDLWVKRPNLFNWHMTQPDESILVSDGKTLWFYNPFVEQATATWLKDATGNTPFMLIARNQSSDWQQYNIKQNGDDFVLTPKASNGNLKQFTINVGRDGTIHQFSGEFWTLIRAESPNLMDGRYPNRRFPPMVFKTITIMLLMILKSQLYQRISQLSIKL